MIWEEASVGSGRGTYGPEEENNAASEEWPDPAEDPMLYLREGPATAKETPWTSAS